MEDEHDIGMFFASVSHCFYQIYSSTILEDPDAKWIIPENLEIFISQKCNKTGPSLPTKITRKSKGFLGMGDVYKYITD